MIATVLVTLLNLAPDVPANGPPPRPERLYHVGGGYYRHHNDEFVDIGDQLFLTYDDANAYARRVSRRYPNATVVLDRIVSYDDGPGAIRVGVALTEADLLEWYQRGHMYMRTAPDSRECGDADVVRWHVMDRLCEGALQ